MHTPLFTLGEHGRGSVYEAVSIVLGLVVVVELGVVVVVAEVVVVVGAEVVVVVGAVVEVVVMGVVDVVVTGGAVVLVVEPPPAMAMTGAMGLAVGAVVTMPEATELLG
jgi:hypothetical protein